MDLDVVQLKLEPLYPRKCISCNRILGHKWQQYREMRRSGKTQSEILRIIGVRDPCCLQSLDISCNNDYQQSLIKTVYLTSGKSPLVSVIDAAVTVRPVIGTGLIRSVATSDKIIKEPIPYTFDDLIQRITDSLDS